MEAKLRDAPGLREKCRQRTTSVHIKDPRIRLDRHAEVIPVDATMMNLHLPSKRHSGRENKEMTHSARPDFGLVGS